MLQSADKIFPLFRTFAQSFHSLCPEKPWVTKLSSAGLVYLHFGRQLLAQLTQLKEGERQLEVLYDKVRGGKMWIYSICNHVLCTTQKCGRCFPSPHLHQRHRLSRRWKTENRKVYWGVKASFSVILVQWITVELKDTDLFVGCFKNRNRAASLCRKGWMFIVFYCMAFCLNQTVGGGVWLEINGERERGMRQSSSVRFRPRTVLLYLKHFRQPGQQEAEAHRTLWTSRNIKPAKS